MNKNDCKECFRIACKQCDWVATDEEVVLIQQEKLTECPICGWKPGAKNVEQRLNY